ncbi:ScpA family protein [uncultured Methylovirgula sp.]|uniref:segregation and condensation protein A n=1 Tax=uncultured Methylovirgula sp. TaxID=1285960 RepID=UPI00261D0A8D|nr:ScpA family protein [uncultured Methylovirgula sp.]
MQPSESEQNLAFEQNAATGEPAFFVDVDGFEGPLDLLLELARRQKVDLAKISVLALAEQYLAFIEAARNLRFELAADYLVMAAWLAYLKSRLLLPQQEKEEEPLAEDLAAALALRLQRLEAIRAAAEALMLRPRLGREIFMRGQPEGVEISRRPQWQASLHDLLAAYARQRQKQASTKLQLRQRFTWSLVEARAALERLIGQAPDWTVLDSFLSHYFTTPEARRAVKASSLAAALEMVRQGAISLRQDQAFAPLWIKKRDEAASPAPLQ